MPISWINKAILYSFYCIFFFVPLVMSPFTSELFEFNKMWLTFGLTILVCFLWGVKIIMTKRIFIRKTPLDIPLLLFLASQIIASIISLDPYVSWWGYYSRFNGGLASTICYVLLYYAFATNLAHKVDTPESSPITKFKTHQPLEKPNPLLGYYSYRILLVSIFTGVIVALWGLPSHYGYDPTCLVFRGELDVKCWTEAFQPRLRIFSTLGQPNWLAAYLAILIPISLGLTVLYRQKKQQQSTVSRLQNTSDYSFLIAICFSAITALFYLDLLFTNSISGIGSVLAALVIFSIGLFFLNFKENKQNKLIPALVAIGLFLCITAYAGKPLLDRASTSLTNFGNKLLKTKTQQPTQQPSSTKEVIVPREEGGTDSLQIRFNYVWPGAVEIFKQHPLIGTGVETFAYAYYKVKPTGHNLTSEWDYLYNKAHNEFLNYLATTGIFGFGTYMLFIGWFVVIAIRKLISLENSEQNNAESNKQPAIDREKQKSISVLILALLTSYLTIHITNFFGFSVVIVNLYVFLIPLFAFDLLDMLKNKALINIAFGNLSTDSRQKANFSSNTDTFLPQGIAIMVLFMIFLYMQVILGVYWFADTKYARGNGNDKSNNYVEAYDDLVTAVNLKPTEDVFKDELATNKSILAFLSAKQNQATEAAKLASESKQLTDTVVKNHPNNVVFWKSRTKILYTLSLLDPNVLPEALDAITTASELAPTDAKILHSKALIQESLNEKEGAVESLKRAIELKPNFRDAYFELGKVYLDLAKEEKNSVKSQELKAKAKEVLEFTIKNIEPNDPKAKELLNET